MMGRKHKREVSIEDRSKPVVRHAKTRDQQNLLGLESEMFPLLTDASIFRAGVPFQAMVSAMSGAVLIAEISKQFAGYAMGQPWQLPHMPRGWKGDVFMLRQIAVAPRKQGRGAGTELMRAIYDVARAKGHKVVLANISTESRPFYEREGWTVSASGQTACWLESARASIKVLGQPATPSPMASGCFSQSPNADSGYSLMAFKKITDDIQPAVLFFDQSEQGGAARVFAEKAVHDDEFLMTLHPSAVSLMAPEIAAVYGPGEALRVKMKCLYNHNSNGTADPAELRSLLGQIA